MKIFMKIFRISGTRSQAADAMRAMLGVAATLCIAAGVQAQDLPEFERLVLDTEFQGGYGVDFADIDGDGLTDVVAWATNPGQLAWFRNPDWDKYAVTSTMQGNISSAPLDIDGDGDTDLALAHDFSLGNSTGGGVIHWLENPGDPMVNEEWQAHYIDEIPTSHRIRWADVNGDGRQELVNLPIVGIGASAPLYDVGLQLKSYLVPQDLSVESWNGVVLDHGLELSHGMSSVDWDGDGREDLLTASFGGVHLFQLATNGQAVSKTQVGEGLQDPERPNIGSSEVDAGSFPGGGRFIATVEPWHGNRVVVYRGDEFPWNRIEIDDSLAGGHALITADLDNDDVDEIIVGGRSEPHQLAIYYYDDRAERWRREDLDTGVAVSGLAATDMDGDGDIDLAAIGSSTRNVVVYRNLGR